VSRVLLIARLDLQRVLGVRSNLWWLVGLPIAVTTALSLAFGGGGQLVEDARLTLAVVGPDPAAAQVRGALAARENVSLVEAAGRDARALVVEGTADAVIVVSEGEDQVAVRILHDPTRQISRAAMAVALAAAQRVGVEEAAAELAERIAPEGAELDALSARAAALVRERDEAALGVEVARAAPRLQTATGAEHASLSQALLFALMFTAQAGVSLLVERESGTLNRLVQSPIARWEIIAGKLAAKVGAGAAQLLILMAYGRLVLGVDWFARPLEVGFVLLAFAFFASAYGLMLGAIFRSADQLGAVAMVSVFALSALGGLLWPLEIVPGAMRQLGSVLPTGAAITALTDLVSRGQGWDAALRGAAILGLYGAGAFAVGLRGFKTDV
jgi:ABC-2 type transport system permease protein